MPLPIPREAPVMSADLVTCPPVQWSVFPSYRPEVGALPRAGVHCRSGTVEPGRGRGAQTEAMVDARRYHGQLEMCECLVEVPMIERGTARLLVGCRQGVRIWQ